MDIFDEGPQCLWLHKIVKPMDIFDEGWGTTVFMVTQNTYFWKEVRTAEFVAGKTSN